MVLLDPFKELLLLLFEIILFLRDFTMFGNGAVTFVDKFFIIRVGFFGSFTVVLRLVLH